MTSNKITVARFLTCVILVGTGIFAANSPEANALGAEPAKSLPLADILWMIPTANAPDDEKALEQIYQQHVQDIQEMTDRIIATIDSALADKEQEIMQV